MIYYLSQLLTNEDMEEDIPGWSGDFPFVATYADLNRYADCHIPWHWHNCFEAGMVEEGVLEIQTENDMFRLRAGEGYWLNVNALHQFRKTEKGYKVKFRAYLFDRSLVAPNPLIERKYIGPLIASRRIEAVSLKPGRDDAALRSLEAAFVATRDEPPGFEMEIASEMTRVCLGIYKRMAQELKREQGASWESERIRTMLDYIYRNYAEDISPAQIAAAAGVCERECFRCFRQTLGATPVSILIGRRINAAMRLLDNKEMTITEIAVACGFSSVGYFGKVFRKKTGLTPGEYRKKL